MRRGAMVSQCLQRERERRGAMRPERRGCPPVISRGEDSHGGTTLDGSKVSGDKGQGAGFQSEATLRAR